MTRNRGNQEISQFSEGQNTAYFHNQVMRTHENSIDNDKSKETIGIFQAGDIAKPSNVAVRRMVNLNEQSAEVS